jgi:peroxiredoxin
MSRQAAQGNTVLGSRVPEIDFGRFADGQFSTLPAKEIFARHRTIALGVPGAFTPACSDLHVPDFIHKAPQLRASGFSQLLCIAPNDPFVLRAWADALDPTQQILFLSDGNLDSAEALGMTIRNRAMFLGKCCERSLMIVEDGIITRMRSEPDGILAPSPNSRLGLTEMVFI